MVPHSTRAAEAGERTSELATRSPEAGPASHLDAHARGEVPERYAAAKKANAGNGSAYPEGFTIDVEVLDPNSFPLRVRAILTSDPKGIGEIPKVDSHLDAVIDKHGKFTVTDFKLGPAVSHHF